jgi:pimeloyl-ACP methyl ester carboxylesterase
MEAEMSLGNSATFICVPGGFSCGADFAEISATLRSNGHRVFPMTLTGLGERIHLLSRETSLETHITDVTNTLLYNDLSNVVLVGHSYGGMVITGVADRMPERIAALVYFDALVPKNGESAMMAAAAGSGETPPAPSGEVMPLTAELAELVGIPSSLLWRYKSHPLKTMTDPIHLTGAHLLIHRKIYVRALKFPGMAATYARIQSESGWEFEEIDASHNLMYEAPERLADLLGAMG